MDFGLSEEQRLLEDALRKLLEGASPPARVREVMAGNGFDAALWKALAEQGALGVLVPEAHGGSGLGLLDAALVAQALGRAAAPAPFLGSGVMAPVAIVEGGSEALAREWLPRLATGDARIGVAATERWSRREGAGVGERGDRLAGRSLFAVDACGPDAWLVATDEGSLALVAADAPGLRVEPLETLDRTRRVAELVLEEVPVAGWLGPRGGAEALVDRMLDAGRVAVAADALGACERALDMAVAYAKERVQFGRVIGSFQAVKHLCAEMAAEIEPARSLLWYAAHAFRALPEEAPLAIALAKAHWGEIARFVTRTATEVHGGIGFTDEHDLHLWFKRAHLDRPLLGGPEAMRARAAVLQGWAAVAR